MTLPLEKDTIVTRINGIQIEIVELKNLSKQTLENFKTGDGHKLAEYHIHRALEGIFHIGSHILSRIPGGQAAEYKEIARKLGEFGIMDKSYANGALSKMAGYRNRIVHFYAEIIPEELYGIINNDLGDFEIFLKAVKNVLEHPEKFDLTVE
ncbi:hypothetical protein A2W54_04075 [Candidatus Giovannonibacteria bacterium RIFCSPHIGHO2_02_43_13]|uniref:DUF86 domain-containing protein n=1 Tax=Candidatus Giovannonibacteria bacterium RIFCSPHIGHO2_02_43_13 TaxID=1798330 RepID=A0A1F5WT23_9BACT|nr:MAG: hypothetical protein UW28_C0009G0012 [Parcubacteria group bacterium GW2011_GWA2_44_13]OGF71731.1 MAG: hypothetical protein A3E06_04190 [Candidatus Giovannonibacteria bacterium RIFCSPHIGHO2_12_FULL_44_42]OGF78780.1 MAG: hypothetical protein A2W54_04075 [Candidatus Giovannonibacteria bacterium RIFCSPHIGHO2_02_43_13]OGF90346.1 MAG: hypothetical protein A3I94_02055 [Candidatus Giovannonibacteria bacterium RIFCSPLOWO2_02_FULL_43_54]OGF96843.1 MAG: hypothetical protein A3H08_00905 [Candidatus